MARRIDIEAIRFFPGAMYHFYSSAVGSMLIYLDDIISAFMGVSWKK